jgi:predicted secreted hydrolase
MKDRKVVVALAILLLAFLAIFWWQSLTFSVDTPLADDNSFSKILSQDAGSFVRALKPRKFSFPTDHGAHDQYRTEWWYFTGNLKNPYGRKFGYELTFFRFALKAETPPSKSVWRNNQIYMAHVTLTDVEDNHFYTDERLSRAGNNLAGASNKKYQVWLQDWSASAIDDSGFPLRLQAKSAEFAIDLSLKTRKDLVLQGEQGLSQKSEKLGNASYYYSYSRLMTEGSINIGDNKFSVMGDSWMDREWSTSSLSKEQAGWDWFALQLADNSELMFYQLRRKDGQQDSNSSGSIILADSSKIPLKAQDVEIKVLDTWRSPHSNSIYPSKWHLSIPNQNLEIDVIPLINDQELNVSYRYWEGAVSVNGIKNGKSISGQGYVELTGYKSLLVKYFSDRFSFNSAE